MFQNLGQKLNNLLHLVLPDPILNPLAQLELFLALLCGERLVHDLLIEHQQDTDNEANESFLMLDVARALGQSDQIRNGFRPLACELASI